MTCRKFRSALALLAAFILAGCAAPQPPFLQTPDPVCPAVHVLRDLDRRERMAIGADGAEALSVFTVFEKLAAECGLAEGGALPLSLLIEMRARTGPALRADDIYVPLVVAPLAPDGEPIVRQRHTIIVNPPGDTPPGEAFRWRGTLRLTLPLAAEDISSHTVYVGHVLSEDELARNRAAARALPAESADP